MGGGRGAFAGGLEDICVIWVPEVDSPGREHDGQHSKISKKPLVPPEQVIFVGLQGRPTAL